MNRPKHRQSKLPTKWLIAIVAGLVIYGLIQPTLKKRLGLNLPSVGSILNSNGQEQGGPQPPSENSGRLQDQPTKGVSPSTGQTPRSGSTTQTSAADNGPASSSSSLKYGLLKDAGGGAYLSPEGLLYAPYSGPDRHRLDHIARHTKDDPGRPIHGVFEGDMPRVVVWLDEAYAKIKANSRAVKKVPQGSRDRYDVRLGSTIGYVGGRDGKRDNNPKSQTVRMILEKTKVITAYPIR